MPHASLIIVGHAISAVAYAALAIWLLQNAGRGRKLSRVQIAFMVALGFTSLWSLVSLASPAGSALGSAMETVRNAAWLLFMILLPFVFGRGKPLSAAGYVYSALFMITGLELLLLLFQPGSMSWAAFNEEVYGGVSDLLRMIFAVGALMLVHDLYRSSDSDTRWGIALPLGALAAMWCYDLNLYTLSYLGIGAAGELTAMRGFGMAVLVMVFALGTRRNSRMQISLSRSAAIQSASLIAIGLYLAAMLVTAWAVDSFAGANGTAYAIGAMFAMSVIGLFAMPSDRMRGWIRVTLEKHFFTHRYDYREEWLRFAETIGRTDDHGPIGDRVLKAVCDICQSPGALLLMPDNIGHFRIAGRWDWQAGDPRGELLSHAAAQAFEGRNFVLDLENARKGIGASAAFPAMPGWALAEPRAWIMLPFVHLGRLVGVAVLEKPRVIRPLDWEDFDMLRIASAQAASYLAEEQGRETLAESQRFEEFNRRFAFIMHDIKNLVSQLSLLARNAERHADNPEFRADMVETLRSSVEKMNDLLARLSKHKRGRVEDMRVCDLVDICGTVVGDFGARHPVTLIADRPVSAMVDPARVGTILGHLLQNAIDACAKEEPIQIRVQEKGGMATVSVIDCGKGISEEFLREKLFKPFSSDKEGGFGIGAYEAQMLARAMGGRIEVESRVGIGSRFTVHLPLAFHIPEASEREAAA